MKFPCYGLILRYEDGELETAKSILADAVSRVDFKLDNVRETLASGSEFPGEFYHAPINKTEDPSLEEFRELHPLGFSVDSREPASFTVRATPDNFPESCSYAIGHYPSGHNVAAALIMFPDYDEETETPEAIEAAKKLPGTLLIVGVIAIVLVFLFVALSNR